MDIFHTLRQSISNGSHNTHFSSFSLSDDEIKLFTVPIQAMVDCHSPENLNRWSLVIYRNSTDLVTSKLSGAEGSFPPDVDVSDLPNELGSLTDALVTPMAEILKEIQFSTTLERLLHLSQQIRVATLGLLATMDSGVEAPVTQPAVQAAAVDSGRCSPNRHNRPDTSNQSGVEAPVTSLRPTAEDQEAAFASGRCNPNRPNVPNSGCCSPDRPNRPDSGIFSPDRPYTQPTTCVKSLGQANFNDLEKQTTGQCHITTFCKKQVVVNGL